MTKPTALARREFMRIVSLTGVGTAAACGSSPKPSPDDDPGSDGGTESGDGGGGSDLDGGGLGGDGGVARDDGGHSGPGDGGAGDGDAAVVLPDADLAGSVPALVAFANTLLADSTEVRRAKMLSFLQEQPDVMVAGANDDGVWAIYKNFVPLMFLDNRGMDAPAEAPGVPLTPFANTDLPKGTRARLINAMGNFYVDETVAVGSILKAKGYSTVSDPGTVESLRSLSGDGVLYFSAHGGLCEVPVFDEKGRPVLDSAGMAESVSQFGIWTRTPFDPTRPNQYLADLQGGYLGIGIELNDYSPDKTQVLFAAHYYVTELWALERWKFAPDALLWMSACRSTSPIAEGFISACLGTGKAAMYVGWTENVSSGAAHLAAKFVIDRLAGTNLTTPKESPPQRAFDHVAVWADLKKRGLHLHPRPGGGGNTQLTYRTSTGTKLGMLAPSIDHVLIDEYGDKAILLGAFGTPPASERSVLIGGVEAEAEWTDSKLTVTLPRTGTGSAGDVVVSVRGHDSNVRRITEWNMQFRYSYVLDTYPNCKIDGPLTVRFRADVGSYRDAPAAAPIEPVRYAIATRDSLATITGSGTSSVDECTSTYSGSADLPAGGFASYPQMLVSAQRIDVATKQLAVGLAIGATVFPWKQTVTCPDSPPYTGEIAPPFGLLEELVQFESPLDNMQGGPQLPAILAQLGDDWGVPGGVFEQNEDGIVIRFEWDASPASFPPDANAAR